MSDFDDKETTRFNQKMFPHAKEIYQSIWPGSTVVDMRGEPLDKNYGIDLHLVLPSGQYITVQEKYRNHDALVKRELKVRPPSPDFTQGYTKAVGTIHEAPGEWSKLAAQLYFYGWSDIGEKSFKEWVLVDVLKYKLLIEEAGGFEAMEKRGECSWQQNVKHGLTGFFAFPVIRLKSAFVYEHLGVATKEEMELDEAYQRCKSEHQKPGAQP